MRVAGLTVTQYEAMISKGILPEGVPVELINGLLVLKDRADAGGDPMTIGPHHQLVLNKLARLAPRFAAHGCFLALQAPIRIPPSHEPEPDASIVAGTPEDYADRHPSAKDVHSVIEVSDSSLETDRTTKLRIYEAARIRQYIIINVAERQVEIYHREGRAPDYAGPVVRKRDDSVAISAGVSSKYVTIRRAAELFP